MYNLRYFGYFFSLIVDQLTESLIALCKPRFQDNSGKNTPFKWSILLRFQVLKGILEYGNCHAIGKNLQLVARFL